VTIEVTLFATLTRYRPRSVSSHDPICFELAAGNTLADLVTALGIPADIPFIALVNGEEASADRRLATGDSVTLFPPLAGGR
jgi:sulfur carrier protein ThiS